MLAIKSKYLLILSIVLIAGCIEDYTPQLNETVEKLVVDGSIIKGEQTQRVVISRSTSVYNAQFIPESGCYVWVLNSNGNQFLFNETEPGVYTADIPQNELAFNTEYTLYITTPDGNEYESETETILESPEVSDIYYERTSNSDWGEGSSDGLQFYVDLYANNYKATSYRWVVEETWEHRAFYEAPYMLDAKNDSIIEMSTVDSLTICYSTQLSNNIYTASTENLSKNEKKKAEINYDKIENRKFNYNYSILIKQYSLNENAYNFWNQNQKQNINTGGLYQSQPSHSVSNINNISNKKEIVLGFFWASSFTEKRFILENKYFYSLQFCKADTVDRNKLGIYSKNLYLTVLGAYEDGKSILGIPESQTCIDCRLNGGTIIKPDFFK